MFHCTMYGVTNLVTDVTKRVTREESLTFELRRKSRKLKFGKQKEGCHAEGAEDAEMEGFPNQVRNSLISNP